MSERQHAARESQAIAQSPLPYQRDLCAYFREHEPELWKWFADHRANSGRADALRFELLKSTYRLDPETHSRVYGGIQRVSERLGLSVPVTCYQVQNPKHQNASLAFDGQSAHLILEGPVTESLSNEELIALVAHELFHLVFWLVDDGNMLITDQIVHALVGDEAASDVLVNTARRWQLYGEIYCDRGALQVAADPHPVVSTLVKLDTGVPEVNPQRYIEQAAEIFQRGPAITQGISHPESFIRARAVQLFASRDSQVDAKVAAMLEGPLGMDSLDLLGQRQVAALTRHLIDSMLSYPAIRSDAVLAHARLFFDDYQPPGEAPDQLVLADDFQFVDRPLQDYFCFVLLDLITADRDLEELPLVAALVLAESFAWKPRLLELMRQELRLRKGQLERIDQQRAELLKQLTGG